mmetsp:Transcript_27650/g.85406  ORF Transcript_27650/g.85406 Transcript_27650/m.85406 type:complete len:823 (-) Transcript_27650:4728-7196(-)
MQKNPSATSDAVTATSTGTRQRNENAPARCTWASYEEFQAKLLVQQGRDEMNNTLVGAFCLADFGKWRHCGIPGQATRTYWFRRQLQEKGKRRKFTRNLIASRLRKETSRGLIRVRRAKLASLLSQASCVRGAGRIAVDVHRARILLARRCSAEACAETTGRYVRGFYGRHFSKIQSFGTGKAIDVKRQQQGSCLLAAKIFVTHITDVSVAGAVYKLTEPAHLAVRRVDGVLSYFLVYLLYHRERVSVTAKRMYLARPYCGGGSYFQLLAPILDRNPLISLACQDHPGPCMSMTEQYTVSSFSSGKGLLVRYNPATQMTCAKDMDDLETKTSSLGVQCASGLSVSCEAPLVYGDHWTPFREENSLKEWLHTTSRHAFARHISWTRAAIAAAEAAENNEASRLQSEATAMALEEAGMRRQLPIDSLFMVNRVSFCYAKTQSSCVCVRFHAEYTLQIAIGKSEMASAWSRAEIAAFDASDAAPRDDWRQSFDPYEVGADWKALRLKRINLLQQARLRTDEAVARLAACEARLAVTKSSELLILRQMQMIQAQQGYHCAKLFCEKIREVKIYSTACAHLAMHFMLRRMTITRPVQFGAQHHQHLSWRLCAPRPRRCAVKGQSNGPGLNAMDQRITTLQASPSRHLTYLITLRQDLIQGALLLVAECATPPFEYEQIFITPTELQGTMKGAVWTARQCDSPGQGGGSCNRNLGKQIKTLFTAAILRQQLIQKLTEALSAELYLDVFTGKVRMKGVSASRRRQALEDCLCNGDTNRKVSEQGGTVRALVAFARPCGRWWLDITIARRSFQRGVLVCALCARIDKKYK